MTPGDIATMLLSLGATMATLNLLARLLENFLLDTYLRK